MKHFLAVLKQLLSSYLSAALAYRLDFLQSVVTSLLWSGFSFISAFLITSQTPSVFGLDRSELLLLAATYGIIVGTHHLLCSRGFEGFSEVIHKGELDGYLLRPFDTVTFLSIRSIGWGSAPRILGSIILVGVLEQMYHLAITPLTALAFLLLSVGSFFIIYSIYTIGCTFLVWHSYLSNIIDLISTSVGTSRYPLAIIKFTPLLLAAVYVPFLVIVNIPTQALIGRLPFWEAGAFVVFSLSLFLFSRWFWRFALRSYTGASA